MLFSVTTFTLLCKESKKGGRYKMLKTAVVTYEKFVKSQGTSRGQLCCYCV